jgi:4-hydroxy-2-oxoheptanedioate aldolase
MDLPRNAFKAALKAGRVQTGIWNAIPGPVVTEMLALAGFDWVLVDTEHAPAEVTDVLPALQTLAAYPSVSALVRPAWNDTVLIKRLLDLGAQTLLVPYVETPEAARAAVAAVRYPPAGVRGIGGLTRATRYGQVEGYVARAVDEICLLVQVETATALADIAAIATTPGVDGVFIGPSDLAASLGHPGNPGHPDVRAAIEGAITTLRRLGVPSGILTPDEDFTRRSIALGATFPALGIDTALLGRGLRDLRARFA